uniref:Uncharacterized protein n=1 Tax=Anguilla anguilla TaxID=7936 RepID=A0A0E9S1T8_ANGAN
MSTFIESSVIVGIKSYNRVFVNLQDCFAELKHQKVHLKYTFVLSVNLTG